jgi:hypothetical protein
LQKQANSISGFANGVTLGLVAGLPTNAPQWDDLQRNHIVALYRCMQKRDTDFSYVFVAYLLNPEEALDSDQHDVGVTRTTALPAKLYVPKAKSTLLDMCAERNSDSELVGATFMHPTQLHPSLTGFSA